MGNSVHFPPRGSTIHIPKPSIRFGVRERDNVRVLPVRSTTVLYGGWMGFWGPNEEKKSSSSVLTICGYEITTRSLMERLIRSVSVELNARGEK